MTGPAHAAAPPRSAHPLARLARTLSRRRQLQLALTLLVILAGAAAEILTIGLVQPFLRVLVAGAGTIPPRPALLFFGAAAAAAGLRVLLLWLNQHLAMGISHDMATSIFQRMLRAPYREHADRHSSEILTAVDKVLQVVTNTMQPLLQGITALVLAACILVTMVAISPLATAAAICGAGGFYLASSLLARRRLEANSTVIATSATSRNKLIQEGHGAIRDVILDRSEAMFEDRFRRLDRQLRRAMTVNVIVTAAPRHVVEGAAIIVFGATAWLLTAGTSLVAALPALSAVALGGQRLLPLLQQIYAAWSLSAGNRQSLLDVLAQLETPIRPLAPAEQEPTQSFGRQIACRRVSFRYRSGPWILRNVDLVITRGSRTGIVGASGSGKSSFVDLLTGLLDPAEGTILIDGAPLDDMLRPQWQSRIAYVPQSVFLTDDSIAANIAFGAGAADPARLHRAAQLAALDQVIDALPEGYDTRIGERGARLSGGQRQRVGIARALYRQRPMLILDEATSALDAATERQVMDSIVESRPDITVIMIAHRPASLGFCDRILRLEGRALTTVSSADATQRDVPLGAGH